MNKVEEKQLDIRPEINSLVSSIINNEDDWVYQSIPSTFSLNNSSKFWVNTTLNIKLRVSYSPNKTYYYLSEPSGSIRLSEDEQQLLDFAFKERQANEQKRSDKKQLDELARRLACGPSLG